METFAVLGGDLRFAYLAGLLAEEGYKVIASGIDNTELAGCVTGCTHVAQAIAPADYIILPFPMTVDGKTLNAPFSRLPIPLKEVWDAVRPDQRVFGGLIPSEAGELLTARHIRWHDYGIREELAIQNAVPTAEGAVQIAMEELPVTLNGTACLITGFGRVAKALAQLLVAIGAQVTVAARKCSDRALAETYGCDAIHPRSIAEAGDFKVYFNTVPALLFDASLLAALPRRALIIDLASRPGGVDLAAAGSLGMKAIWALALPGRVAPKTAGGILLKTVWNILNEREETV